MVDFKYIWFKVPQKFLRQLFYSNKSIDHKTYQKLLYYRRVLEDIANKTQHLVSVIDRIILRR